MANDTASIVATAIDIGLHKTLFKSVGAAPDIAYKTGGMSIAVAAAGIHRSLNDKVLNGGVADVMERSIALAANAGNVHGKGIALAVESAGERMVLGACCSGHTDVVSEGDGHAMIVKATVDPSAELIPVLSAGDVGDIVER